MPQNTSFVLRFSNVSCRFFDRTTKWLEWKGKRTKVALFKGATEIVTKLFLLLLYRQYQEESERNALQMKSERTVSLTCLVCGKLCWTFFSDLPSLVINSLHLFVLYFQAYQKTIDRLEKELKQAKAAVSKGLSFLLSWQVCHFSLFHAKNAQTIVPISTSCNITHSNIYSDSVLYPDPCR